MSKFLYLDAAVLLFFDIVLHWTRLQGFSVIENLMPLFLLEFCWHWQFLFFVRLQQWLRRKTLDAPCEADSGPTASIRCPHGELLPEKAAGARRLLIPETLWLFIVESANTVKPNDLEGCSVFLLESEPCGICSTNLSEEACEEDSMRLFRYTYTLKVLKVISFVSYWLYNLWYREFKLKQRQSHEKLAQGKSVTLSSNSKYYLIPSSWLSNWRSFISTSGKNASPPPETLNSVLELLKCEQVSWSF